MSIHGTYGCLRTLDCLRRSLGNHARDNFYRIHRMRYCGIKILTRKKSSKNTPAHQSYYMVNMYLVSRHFIDISYWNWIFSLDVFWTYCRSSRTNYITKSSTPRKTRSRVWIWAITRKYRVPTHSIFYRTTHTISRDAVGSDWWHECSCRKLVVNYSRSCHGSGICSGRNFWSNYYHSGFFLKKLQKSLKKLSGLIIFLYANICLRSRRICKFPKSRKTTGNGKITYRHQITHTCLIRGMHELWYDWLCCTTFTLPCLIPLQSFPSSTIYGNCKPKK